MEKVDSVVCLSGLLGVLTEGKIYTIIDINYEWIWVVPDNIDGCTYTSGNFYKDRFALHIKSTRRRKLEKLSF